MDALAGDSYFLKNQKLSQYFSSRMLEMLLGYSKHRNDFFQAQHPEPNSSDSSIWICRKKWCWLQFMAASQLDCEESRIDTNCSQLMKDLTHNRYMLYSPTYIILWKAIKLVVATVVKTTKAFNFTVAFHKCFPFYGNILHFSCLSVHLSFKLI